MGELSIENNVGNGIIKAIAQLKIITFLVLISYNLIDPSIMAKFCP